MPLELQRVTDDNFDDWARAVERGFLGELDDEDLPGWRSVLQPRDRFIGMQDDDGRWIATAGALPYRMSIPGGDRVGCAGVTVITVRSDHRRQGLLTTMMGTLLDDARHAGEPFAALLASEGGIYGRYGYGPSAPSVDFEVDRRHAVPVGMGRADRVQLVDRERARGEYPAIYDAMVDRHPGTMSQSEGWWDGHLNEDTSADQGGASKRWHALIPGKGFAIYRTKNDWEGRVPNGKLKVSLMASTDRDTYADLVAFLASVDLITTISLRHRPTDDPLPLLLADESQVRDRSSMPLWLRLLDLPVALTSRAYDVADQLVLEVVDRTLPDNQGTWLLDVSPDGSSCERTDTAADLRMDVSALGSVFLGGYRPTTLHAAGRIDELTPGAVPRLGKIMRTDVAPWCAVGF
jgi:predicted acetyltransferase